MAHSDCGWTCGCAGKTVRSLENTCHTWALLRWWFATKRRYIKCMHLYAPVLLSVQYRTRMQRLRQKGKIGAICLYHYRHVKVTRQRPSTSLIPGREPLAVTMTFSLEAKIVCTDNKSELCAQ